MANTAASSENSPEAPGRCAVTERGLAQLTELADIGLGLARSLERHAQAAEHVQAETSKVDPYCLILPPADYAVLAQAFSRIARAVRMTIALQGRLLNPRRRSVEQTVRTATQDPAKSTDPLATEPRENLHDHADPIEVQLLPCEPARTKTGGGGCECRRRGRSCEADNAQSGTERCALSEAPGIPSSSPAIDRLATEAPNSLSQPVPEPRE
jgi:hypothetical protein